MVLLMGDRDDDPLFLQVKEAEHVGARAVRRRQRVRAPGRAGRAGSALTQAASDAFLGWVTGTGERRREFYVRQLRDMKGSAAIETMPPERLARYGELCGATLARAHARTGDAAKITGYLGDDDTFDRALEQFAVAYADQNDADYAAFTDAADERAHRRRTRRLTRAGLPATRSPTGVAAPIEASLLALISPCCASISPSFAARGSRLIRASSRSAADRSATAITSATSTGRRLRVYRLAVPARCAATRPLDVGRPSAIQAVIGAPQQIHVGHIAGLRRPAGAHLPLASWSRPAMEDFDASRSHARDGRPGGPALRGGRAARARRRRGADPGPRRVGQPGRLEVPARRARTGRCRRCSATTSRGLSRSSRAEGFAEGDEVFGMRRERRLRGVRDRARERDREEAGRREPRAGGGDTGGGHDRVAGALRPRRARARADGADRGRRGRRRPLRGAVREATRARG